MFRYYDLVSVSGCNPNNGYSFLLPSGLGSQYANLAGQGINNVAIYATKSGEKICLIDKYPSMSNPYVSTIRCIETRDIPPMVADEYRHFVFEPFIRGEISDSNLISPAAFYALRK